MFFFSFASVSLLMRCFLSDLERFELGLHPGQSHNESCRNRFEYDNTTAACTTRFITMYLPIVRLVTLSFSRCGQAILRVAGTGFEAC